MTINRQVTINIQGKGCQFNNSVTFSGKSIMGSEDLLNRMVEDLGISIDRGPKGRTCKRGNYLNKERSKKNIERH